MNQSTIPPTLQMGLIVSVLSITVATAMFLLVLWQAPHRRENQLMALYMLTVVVWGFGGYWLRESILLQHPAPSMVYLISVMGAFNSLSLLALAAYMSGWWARRWLRWVVVGSVLYFMGVFLLAFRGEVMTGVTLAEDGRITFHLTVLGLISFSLAYLYYLLAAYMLWHGRQHLSIWLIVGAVMASLSIPIRFLPDLGGYSQPVLLAALSSIFFAWAILQTQLFNPLHQLNAQLQASEEKLTLLLENIRLPVLALYPDMTIFYCNQAYANFVGQATAELTGKSLLQLFPSLARTRSYQAYQQVLQTGQSQEAEGKLGDRLLLARIYPAPWGLLAISEDITLRKQAEEALAMSRMKTELLAKVSHELRTPMSAILGYADILQSGTLVGRQGELLERIVVNTEKLLAQVNGMLDQSQIELGQIHLAPTPFSAQKLLQNVHASLDVLAEQKGLRFTDTIDPHLPPELHGDMQRILQIVVNLAANGLKFTEAGEVHIELARHDADFWLIRVRDTGIGIPEMAQSYIFEPFRQVNVLPTREYGGVGLGLSIVKQLVELMQGKISLESRMGQGSTFTVLLPWIPVSG